MQGHPAKRPRRKSWSFLIHDPAHAAIFLGYLQSKDLVPFFFPSFRVGNDGLDNRYPDPLASPGFATLGFQMKKPELRVRWISTPICQSSAGHPEGYTK